METLSVFADIVGLATVLFSLFAWLNTLRIRKDQEREKIRLSQKIRVRVKLKGGEKFFDLPGEMRRAELTRAEVLGWIGMVPRIQPEKKERFAISYLNSADFFEKLNQIKEGSGETMLLIECVPEEFNQFDLDMMKANQATAKETK